MKTKGLLFLLVCSTLLFTACDRSDAQGEGAAQTQAQTESAEAASGDGEAGSGEASANDGDSSNTTLDEASEDSGSSNTSAANVRTVRTTLAEQGALSTSRSTSVTIEPAQESQVAATVGGQVAQILKREGATVEQGETVIRLDDENLRYQVQNARTAVQSARVNLQTSSTASQETTQQSQSQLQSAQVALRNARQQYESGQQIFERGGISQTELNNLEAQFQQAQTSYQQAQDALNRAQRAPSESLELQQLQLEQAQTQLAQAERALADANIKAPFAGEISEVSTEIGEFLGAGTPAFTVISTENQLAKFSVPVQDARRLVEQGEIYIRYGGLDYGAQVVRSSQVPGQSRLVDITAQLYPSENRIPTGTTTQFTYRIQLGEGVKLPSGAVRTSGGESYVFAVEDGQVERREVTISSEAGNEVIVSGIDEGTRLVYPLPSDLRDGSRVNLLGGDDG